MPGLAGFSSLKHLSPQGLVERLSAMKRNLIAPENALEHDLFFGPQVAGTQISPPWQKSPRTYRTQTGIIAWMDGDLYNREQIVKQRNWTEQSDIELLVSLITRPDTKSALTALDGLFSLVLLDTHRHQLHILTDRYGLRPLFFHTGPSGISWSSEAKSFLGLPEFSPRISKETAATFLATGQLPPDQSWFDGVTQVPPASHLIYSTASGAITRERYWWWDQLTTRVGKSDPGELVRECGRLFKHAVSLRAQSGRNGLMLSGGLDSRAIFAALPDTCPTYTFGQIGSEEVQISARVASLRASRHTLLPLDRENWLQPRLEAIWWTDGALNLMHMHGVEHLDTICRDCEVSFNGAGGDGLAGGGHLFESHAFPQYLSHALHLDLDPESPARQVLNRSFRNAGSAHAFYIDWRMRGFTALGPRLGLFKGIDFRLPFLDNDLQAFLFSLPLPDRQNNALYRRVLLETFPAYFQTLPWAKTGHPIGASKWTVRASRLSRKVRQKAPPVDLTDYPAWLREPQTRRVIDSLFQKSNARFRELTPSEPFESIWSEHLAGKNHSEQIGRYATLEIFLRQVLEGQYRSREDIQTLFTS